MSDYSKLYTAIWADRDFTALSGDAQRLYLLLLSQESRSLAGVLPLTIRRWAALAGDTTVESITAALHELAAARFVVIDWNTDELLIRTFIRNDELYRQPNVLKGALREAQQVLSAALRWALHSELLKLPDHKDRANTLAAAETLVEGLEQVAREGFPEGFAEGFLEGMGNNLQPTTFNLQPSPSSTQPRVGARVRARPTDFTEMINGPKAPAPPPVPEPVNAEAATTAAKLVSATLPANKYRSATLTGLRIEVGRLLAEDIEPELVADMLRLWDAKTDAGVKLLPHLLAEAEKRRSPTVVTLGAVDRSVLGYAEAAARLTQENHHGRRPDRPALPAIDGAGHGADQGL